MPPLANSPSLFAILSALIEGRAGLHYGPEERDLFLERASARASEAGFESLLDYYYYLRYDDAAAPEFEKLIDALVVNETFFFRELQPLKMLVHRLVAPMVATGRRPRIWSAAFRARRSTMAGSARPVISRCSSCARNSAHCAPPYCGCGCPGWGR